MNKEAPQYLYAVVSQTGMIRDNYNSNVLAKRMCPNGCYIVKYQRVKP